MHADYAYLDDTALESIRAIQRRNLAHLATQAASFGHLYVPLSIQNELEAAKAAIDAINHEIAQRRIQHSDVRSGDTT